jgi:hypothetical protein
MISPVCRTGLIKTVVGTGAKVLRWECPNCMRVRVDAPTSGPPAVDATNPQAMTMESHLRIPTTCS